MRISRETPCVFAFSSPIEVAYPHPDTNATGVTTDTNDTFQFLDLVNLRGLEIQLVYALIELFLE